MGGAVNGEPLDEERVMCHLDFCIQEAGEILLFLNSVIHESYSGIVHSGWTGLIVLS